MEDMKDTDSNTLARIDERTKAHTTDFALHVRDDQDKFEKVFQLVSKSFDKVDEKFDKIDVKLDQTIVTINSKIEPLQNESIRKKGVFDVSRVGIMAAWSLVIIGVGHFWK